MNLRPFIYLFFLILLFFPKVNIINFSFTYVGIKPEDLFVIPFFALCFIHFALKGISLKCNKTLLGLNILTSVYLLYIWLSVLYNSSSLLYLGRYTLYILPILILPLSKIHGTNIASDDFHVERISKYALLMYFILVLFQKLGIIGGFMHGDYTGNVASRPCAIFSHPIELGIVSVLLLIFLLFSCNVFVKQKNLFFLCVLLTNILAQNRTSLVILIIVYVLYIINTPRVIRKSYRLNFLIVTALGLVFLSFPFLMKMERFEKFALPDFIFLYQDSNTITNINDINVKDKAVDIKGDLSLAIRAKKWSMIIKNNTRSIKSVLLGAGIGKFGPAIDGFYIRVWAETGIIGLFLVGFIFYVLFTKFNQSFAMNKPKYILISMLLYSILQDAWYFSRAGYFVWLVFAYYVSSYNAITSTEEKDGQRNHTNI